MLALNLLWIAALKLNTNNFNLKKYLYLPIMLGLLLAGNSHAIEPPPLLTDYLPRVKNFGQGQFTYLGFKVYDASFYAEDPAGQTGFALSLNYLRKISSNDLVSSTVKQLERVGASEEQIGQWKKPLEKNYPDVESGHQIMAVFIPKKGTSFLHNGKPVGNIAGDDFAKSFFGIWLDPKTSYPELRRQLLVNPCSPALINSNCSK